MSRGYLVLCQGEYADMVKHLALSIKKSQTTVNSISVCTDQEADFGPVDYVIPIVTDMAQGVDWKIHNRSQFWDFTPYDETVILDADMLFLSDVSLWWEFMSRFDLLATTRVKTYRNTWVESSRYRETFRQNQIPDVYSAFTYFKKNEKTRLIFNLIKSMMSNWEDWSARLCPESRQPWPSLDLALGMALKVLGLESDCTSSLPFPTFTHMKSGCQGWKNYSEEWRTHIGVYQTDQGLRLGDYLQQGVLHYVDKKFLEYLQ